MIVNLNGLYLEYTKSARLKTFLQGVKHSKNFEEEKLIKKQVSVAIKSAPQNL